jgi:hypothetical protein
MREALNMVDDRATREVIRVGELVLQIRSGGGAIRVEWEGRSNDRDPERVLGPTLSRTLSKAEQSGLRLELHFELLEFFNSATITAIIRHIMAARERRVAVWVHYDPSHRWQKIFFDALDVLDRGDAMLKVTAAWAGR